MPTGRRPRVTHSLENVVEATIALLDEDGEGALTFRALAARLGGGVGSIYWYVSSKDELLDRATDEVMGRVLAGTDDLVDDSDPIGTLRAVSLAMFDEMVRRPWLGSFLMRNTGVQTNSIRLFERLGQQVMRLDLSPQQRFHAVSSIVSYVVGVAVDMAQPPPKEFFESGLEPAEFLKAYADGWRAYDADEFPFLHQIADEFERHDDADVFRSGLDMLLQGLRVQAGA
ncbi:TetR/AcrR family transcriptional regulator C-terminal domain-containing protein [Aeromicrobium fastidiosum]|uniref:TetR/AcrR family transcriptional regulator n=1 Tax=Aeromicrobium fastidiosum TaxID=52699 RepID=UPI0020233C66|nr:TetR/AcrR family transcriptional regulator [Aeromicrobium fastidiosum]MCL8251600.1 TetR/AcrR family transcriptional regulator C-terminal domain-containing protein [Aeromicrobium fastidiosum]